MLTFFALYANGERCALSAPCSFELSQDSLVPADSLYAVFPCEIADELAEIYVTEGKEEIFRGIVDEQIVTFGEEVQTKVIARSMAALLLDNEAKPRNLFCPSAKVIFSLYMEPLGLEKFLGADRCVQGNFDVRKGMSCWQAVENFGIKAFGKAPRIEGATAVFSNEEGAEVVFSDNGEGIPFTSFAHNRLRCRIISKVRAKTETPGDYRVEITNHQAVNSGIIRERYLDATSLSATPLSKAYEVLENSKRNSQEITLVCPCRVTGVLCLPAKVKCSEKLYEGFFVKSLRYSFSAGTEKTRLTLCRKEN